MGTPRGVSIALRGPRADRRPVHNSDGGSVYHVRAKWRELELDRGVGGTSSQPGVSSASAVSVVRQTAIAGAFVLGRPSRGTGVAMISGAERRWAWRSIPTEVSGDPSASNWFSASVAATGQGSSSVPPATTSTDPTPNQSRTRLGIRVRGHGYRVGTPRVRFALPQVLGLRGARPGTYLALMSPLWADTMLISAPGVDGNIGAGLHLPVGRGAS